VRLSDQKAPTGFGSGKLLPFADSLWTATTPSRFSGIWFPHVMSVIRCSGGELVLHSPCQPSASLTDEIVSIGKVAHIVAPNWFHDLYLADYRGLFPEATFWGPATLRRQLGSAIIDCELNEAARPPWFAEMPHFTLSGPLTFDESIFFHTLSRTLIVADLFMNVSSGTGAPRFTRLAYRLSGIEGRLVMPPYLRWFGLAARRSLREAARRIPEWNPDRLIVGHGTPIAKEAMARLLSILG
jgi:Domain of unknown function (DUF4336)